MKRLALAMVLVALMTAPLLAQDDDKPWEAWEPPVVTLPEPNGFDTYLKAFDLKKRVDGQFPPNQPPAEGQPPDRWGEGPANLPLPDRVALYGDVLKLVRVALTQETRIPPVTSSGELMPYLSDIRAIVRLLAMEAEVHRLSGDNLAAAGSALDALAVAQDASNKRIIMSALVGIACEAVATKSLDETIPLLSAEECQSVLKRLLALDRTRLPLKDTLDGEEVFARVCFKEIMNNHAMLGNVTSKDLNAAEAAEVIATMRQNGWQAIGQAYDAFRRTAAQSYSRQTRPFPLPDDPLMAQIAPAVDKLVFVNARSLTALHLREAELAVRAYLLEKGQLPPSLTALVPEYVAEVPSDPFGEGPLLSKLIGGKLVIYSVGPDLKDDGGKPINTKFPETKSKGDIIVEVTAKP